LVRLSDIPPGKLREIERFVREMRGKAPVTGGGWDARTGRYVKNLVEMVEERFGVRLSPQQIYALQRGSYRGRRVSIPEDLAAALERRFGDVRVGLKTLLKVTEEMVRPPSPELERVVDALAGQLPRASYTMQELAERIRGLGYPDPYRVVGDLFREGLAQWRGEKVVVRRFRLPPEVRLASFFAEIA